MVWKKHDQQIYKISILPRGILLTEKNRLSLAYTGMYGQFRGQSSLEVFFVVTELDSSVLVAVLV